MVQILDRMSILFKYFAWFLKLVLQSVLPIDRTNERLYRHAVCERVHAQGGANIGLQCSVWKIIQKLINNNTRINT